MRDLRAEGGLRVTAERRGGLTERISITAPHAAQVRLQDPFGGAPAAWSRPGIELRGPAYELRLERGETITGRRARP
jgi:alpha-L-fucosidase 2